MNNLDLTVRLGDILTMIGLFSGGIAVVFMQRADMKVLSTRLGSLESTVSARLNGITDILVEQGKHDQRLSNVEETLRMVQFQNSSSRADAAAIIAQQRA